MRNAYYQLINYVKLSQERDVFYYAACNILDNLEKIPTFSITQLADKCFASPATISRLVRRLNFESFLDFKESVKQSLDEESYGNFHYYGEPKTISIEEINNVKNTFYNEIVENLTYTNQHFTTQDVIDIVSYIEKAERVVFLGYNFSQAICSQLQSTLASYNKTTIAISNQELQYDVLKETTEDDLLILSTVTGNYFRNRKKEKQVFISSPAKKIIITQDPSSIQNVPCDKFVSIGENNNSYIGKFSLLMLFEMIEMFYGGKQRK